MQRKLPGIDIPAVTEAKILHAAAFLAFKQQVERLARAGSDLQAYACWMHGVDVCHSPYVLATRTDSDLSPPCRRCPVAWTTASAAQPTLAGSSSPGSVCGTAEALCCPQMWLPTKLGATSIGTRSAWTFCWWRPTPPSLRRPTWSPKSYTRFNSDAQRVTLGSWVWERYSTNGAHGWAAWAAEGSCQFLSSRAFTQGLPGGDPGQPGDKKELVEDNMDNPKGSVTLRPVRKTIYKKKPKAINVDKNTSEAVQKRVNGLVSMLIGMGYKPLTDALKAEWKQTCRRVVEKKEKEAEAEW